MIRKEKRDLRRANVFYDIRRTWITRTGFLEEKKVELTKGVKVFPRFVAWTDAEIWLQTKQAEYDPLHSRSVSQPQMTPQDRQQAFSARCTGNMGNTITLSSITRWRISTSRGASAGTASGIFRMRRSGQRSSTTPI